MPSICHNSCILSSKSCILKFSNSLYFMATIIVYTKIIYHLNYFYSPLWWSKRHFSKTQMTFNILILKTLHCFLFLGEADFLGIWHMQFHRVPLLEWPHNWFNALLYHLEVLKIFWQKAPYCHFVLAPHKLWSQLCSLIRFSYLKIAYKTFLTRPLYSVPLASHIVFVSKTTHPHT